MFGGPMKLRILAAAAALALLSACGASNGPATTLDPDAAPDAPADSAPSMSPRGDAAEARGVSIAVTDTDLGAVLSDADGRTLYLFTVDEPGVSTCEGACLETWPPLLSDGAPQSEGAVDPMLLGTLVRSDGSVQVTYGGWPLYFFAGDEAPGDINGQGVNDVWFVVAPDGTMIERAAADSADDPGTDPRPDDSGSEFLY
jgi:predicted lipoprotein with Yx(FWY)xxD motif